MVRNNVHCLPVTIYQGFWNKICLGTGRDNNGEVTFHSDNINTAIAQMSSGSLQEKKTGTRQGENREKIGRR